MLAPAPADGSAPPALRIRLDDGTTLTLFGPHYRNDSIVGYGSPAEGAARKPGTEITVLAPSRIRKVEGLDRRSVLVTTGSGRTVTVYLPVAEQRLTGGELRWLFPSDSVPFQWVATDVEPNQGIALADVVRMETEQIDGPKSVAAGGAVILVVAGLAATVLIISALADFAACEDLFNC